MDTATAVGPLVDSAMLHDVKAIPMSPQKGKARENKNWQAGWWDFQPLADRSFRPLEWSQSSVIFCAHPTQPLITARHFSSSKQFVVASPSPVVSSPASYGPPTVISVSPSDDWLFAYFPGRTIEGVGCLWIRGSQIDSWNIKEWWNFARGAGPVAASWLGQPREWVSGTTPGSAMRWPPLGPRPPVSSPTLLLVTQDHNLNVCYYRQYMSSLKLLSCPIAQAGVSAEGQNALGDPGSAGIKQCFKAAFGMGYNEYSVIIATRSHHVPPPLDNSSRFEPSLQNGIDPNLPPELLSLEWENWGEEAVINIYEVQLLYNGHQMGLSVEPFPPLLGCDGTLVGLDFVSIPPPVDPLNPPPSPRKTHERLSLNLVSSYLDFENYESPPRSELFVHSFIRAQTPNGPNSFKPTWKILKTASRSFTSSIVAYVSPIPLRQHSTQRHVFAGIINTSGSFPSIRSDQRKMSIGYTKVLNLSDLTDDESYEASPILCDVTRLGQDIPLNAVLSPNGALLCTISASLWPLRTLVQSLPRIRIPTEELSHFASSLAEAVVSSRDPSDISHSLSLASTPFNIMVETLYQTDYILDNQPSGFSHPLTLGTLGVVMAMYKEQALAVKNPAKDVTMRWKTAHDLCSLVSCIKAFDDCQDGEIYDLDAVWQLISLSTWIVAFTEELLKECVMSCDLKDDNVKKEHDEHSSMSLSPLLNLPVLLHIAHPFALDKFVIALSHVQRFYAYIKSLSARGEGSQIARDILVDLVGNSGFNLVPLIASLERARQESWTLDRESCRRALVSCQPTADMHLFISKTIRDVTQASILTKPTLFIKPQDLVDGVGSLPAASKKDHDKDVVTKSILAGVAAKMQCLRCEGKTALANDLIAGASVSVRWRAWEKSWLSQCICGGRWESLM